MVAFLLQSGSDAVHEARKARVSADRPIISWECCLADPRSLTSNDSSFLTKQWTFLFQGWIRNQRIAYHYLQPAGSGTKAGPRRGKQREGRPSHGYTLHLGLSIETKHVTKHLTYILTPPDF